jgi:hypothetical protein
LEWLSENAKEASLVLMSGQQFVVLEDELTVNQRFVAAGDGDKPPSPDHIGVTFVDDPSVAYWIKKGAADFAHSRDET